MASHWVVFTSCVLAASLLAAEPVSKLAEKWQKRVNAAESAYNDVVSKADNVRFYAKQKANAERLKILRAVLADATKAGDFDSATVVKGLLDSAEETSGTRAKPKKTIKFGGHEYALIDNKVTWHVARSQCHELGGHLVTFETPQEQEFVLAACRAANQVTWIGVSNEIDVNRWFWVNGKPAVIDSSWTFDNGNRDLFSVAMAYWPETGSFSDHNLGAHASFVCEWDN